MQAKILYAAAEQSVLSVVSTPKRRYEHLCHRIEQLGPAAIKLGQLMATTPGLISDPDLQHQLSSRLHDRVRPQQLAQLLQQQDMDDLTESLGGLAIDAAPVGSASIAQVHKAKAGPDASYVAVKVVRPSAGRLIRSSFAALTSTIKLASRWLPSADDHAAMHHTELLLQDACCMLESEVDMASECHLMQACFDKAQQGSLVDVPKPIGHHLDGRVLVMEYVPARPLAEAQTYMPTGQRRELAQQIAMWWLECVLRHRTVHGDPHVGNWGMRDEGKLVLYDYGNVVLLTATELQSLMRLVEALTAMMAGMPGAAFFRQQAEQAGEACGVHVLGWSTFETDVSAIVGYMTSPGKVNLDAEQMKARRRVAARLSGPALRLVRSLLLIDGVCRSLDPNFAWAV
jgi:ubiquinone biosynthesis protein